MRHFVTTLTAVAFLVGSLSACDGDDAGLTPDEIYAEPIANGFLQYRGAFPPIESGSGGRRTYTWEPDSENGPRCIGDGDIESQRFVITTLDRQSDDLLIFLQGGGLCAASTPGACLRINIPFAPLGVLSGATEQPFAAFNVGYIPYCDGSLFLGDVTQTIDDEVFVQRGRQNITAAMDALSAQFPNPRRVVLLGISGGGFGTVFAGPMARVYFPNAEVLVVNDSGVGITRGEREPAFVDELLEALEADQLVPESCDQCFEGGHAIRFVAWTIENDPDLRMAVVSHTRDNVIAGTFLDVPMDWFEAELRRETAALSERFGDRYGRYLIDAEGHTALLGASPGSPVSVTPIYAWLQQFLDHDPAWQDDEQTFDAP